MDVRIEKRKDGSYVAYSKDLENYAVFGTGDTVTEAKEDFFNTLNEIKELLEEDGQEIPSELMEMPEFHFDISSLFEFYDIINVSAFARLIGINASLMRQYKRGDTYISDIQLNKIEEGIHKVGKELCDLKLV